MAKLLGIGNMGLLLNSYIDRFVYADTHFRLIMEELPFLKTLSTIKFSLPTFATDLVSPPQAEDEKGIR